MAAASDTNEQRSPQSDGVGDGGESGVGEVGEGGGEGVCEGDDATGGEGEGEGEGAPGEGEGGEEVEDGGAETVETPPTESQSPKVTWQSLEPDWRRFNFDLIPKVSRSGSWFYQHSPSLPLPPLPSSMPLLFSYSPPYLFFSPPLPSSPPPLVPLLSRVHGGPRDSVQLQPLPGVQGSWGHLQLQQWQDRAGQWQSAGRPLSPSLPLFLPCCPHEHHLNM